ncbi:hypothetical protein CsSME_00001636 [Camellia sinensis var. sinensis]
MSKNMIQNSNSIQYQAGGGITARLYARLTDGSRRLSERLTRGSAHSAHVESAADACVTTRGSASESRLARGGACKGVAARGGVWKPVTTLITVYPLTTDYC